MSDIDELPSWAPKSEQPETVTPPARSRDGGSSRGLIYALLALSALVVLAGGGYVLLSGGDDDTDTAGGEAADSLVTDTTNSTGDQAATGTGASGDQAATGDAASEGTEAEGAGEEAAPEGPPADNSEGQIRHTSIENGKYVLNGTVPTQEMLDEIYAITVDAAGEENVVNNLTVDPESPAQTTGYPVYIRDVVLFDIGATEVRDEYENLLVAGAEFLMQNPNFAITVIGHADSTGSPEANQQISVDRAEAVKAIYVQLGANPDQVFTIGKGEDDAVEGASSSLAAEERRVDFYIGSVEDGPLDPG